MGLNSLLDRLIRTFLSFSLVNSKKCCNFAPANAADMPRISHISPFPLRPLILAGAVLLLCLSSCSRVQSIREARHVVAEADSLRNAGQSLSPFTFHLSPSKSDSCAMADAAAALEPLRFFYPNAHAHANYYYGRLLREAGNHPEAMLAFLRVVHSCTKDHAIKGRSYCNIGIMCGLATEHELAYDMYERSAEEFLKAQDSIAYYYALIDMAFALAEQKRKDEAVSITNKIEAECRDYYVLTKIWETRADAYIQAQMYDSAIYCVRQLQSRGNQEPTGFLYAAQAYNNLGVRDSALYYANRVLQLSDFYGDRFNALYILTHNDSTINTEEILRMTSDRTDIQMDYTEVRADLSHAIQLLEQDLSRKPNLTWLWTLLVTLCIITTSISIYIRKKKAKHQLISQQMDDAREEHRLLSEQNLLLEAKQEQRQSLALKQIEQYCNSIEVQNFREQLCWDDYKEMCSIINHYMFGLVNMLNEAGLKKKEIQLCVLVIIGKFKGRKMASILCYAENSIRGAKEDVATKLGTTSRNLRSFLLKMATEG